jgi:membrane fusion protein (multidrug efflux system)
MANPDKRRSDNVTPAGGPPASPGHVPASLPSETPRRTAEVRMDSASAPPEKAPAKELHDPAGSASGAPATPAGPKSSPPWGKWLLLGGAVAGLVALGYYLKPTIKTMLNTVSTDDAYVNGHVTFVAPRVAGQVAEVLVDDNVRVMIMSA